MPFAEIIPAVSGRVQPAIIPAPKMEAAVHAPPTARANPLRFPHVSARIVSRFLAANLGRLIVTGLAMSILGFLAFSFAFVTSAKLRLVTPLDFVHTDCDLLIHFRPADIWNSSVIQDFYRQLPDYVRHQSEETVARVGIGLEYIDSITILFTNPEQPALCAVVQTNRKYDSEDQKKILSSTAMAASVKWETRAHRGLNYYLGNGHVPGTPDTPLAIYAASEKLFVLGTELGVKAALDYHLDAREGHSSGKTNAQSVSSNSVAMLEWVRPWINNPDYLFVGAGAHTTNINQIFTALDDSRTSDDVRQRLKATPGVGGLMLNMRPGQAVPPELKTLLAVDSAAIGLKLDTDKVLHIQGQSHFPSVAEAKESGDLLRGLLSVIRLVPEGSATLPEGDPRAKMMQTMSTFLRSIKVESEGLFVSFSAQQNLALLDQGMSEAIRKAMEMQRLELTSAPNLKQLANAFEQYHAQYGHYPPAVVMDASGTQRMYSWRVAILPYVGPEASELHREFHLQEPWDSPHNLNLSHKMPAVFEHPLARMNNKRTLTIDGVAHGITPYQLPVGVAAAFFENRKISKKYIVDGLDQTVMIMEQQPVVPWTAPQDVPVAAGDRTQEVLNVPSIVRGAPIEAVLFDQTSLQIDRSIKPDVFWGMINPSDGQGVATKNH